MKYIYFKEYINIYLIKPITRCLECIYRKREKQTLQLVFLYLGQACYNSHGTHLTGAISALTILKTRRNML